MGNPLTAEIAAEMGLAEDQTGVLVLEVQDASPAMEAGLIGGNQTVTINGEAILIGGDVIVRADGNDVGTVPELAAYLQEAGVGEQVSLAVLRDGNLLTIEATLREQP
jgi:S1-C subfamily serine protease